MGNGHITQHIWFRYRWSLHPNCSLRSQLQICWKRYLPLLKIGSGFKMNNRFHGVSSLSLIFLSILIGLLAILGESFLMGLVYIAAILISIPIVIYSYCSKCICRLDSCGHIFPGKLSKWLPSRKQSNYTFWDILGVILPLIVLFVFPQFWLWKTKILLFVFWVLFIIAFAEIKLFVCKECKNEKCLAHVKKKME